MSHVCPVGRCQEIVEDDYLMCWPHWKLLPNALRNSLRRAHQRARNRGWKGDKRRLAEFEALAIGAAQRELEHGQETAK